MTEPVTEQQPEELLSDAPASETAALDVSAPDGQPEASAPVSETPEQVSEGRQRDERGRFAKAQQDAAQAEGEPAAEQPPAAPVAETPQPTTEQPPIDARPWSFDAGGTTYTLGDSVVVPGVGLVVPEPQIDVLHKMLGRVIKSDSVLAQREQMLTQAREEAAHLAEFNATAAKQWESLAEMVRQGRHDEAYSLLVEFASELPVLRAEAKAQVLERRLTQREEALRPSPDQVYAEAKTDAWRSLDGMFAEALQQPWAQGVTPDDHKAVAELIGKMFDRLVVPAPRDIPEAGIQRGEWVLDTDAAMTLMQRELERASTYRRGLAEATKAREAAAAQAAAQKQRTKESIAAPPTVGGSSGTAAPKSTPAVPKTPEEFAAWLEKTAHGR